jgi:chromosome segregation ATPase
MISVDYNQIAKVLAFEKFIEVISDPAAIAKMIADLKTAQDEAKAAVEVLTKGNTIEQFRIDTEAATAKEWAKIDASQQALSEAQAAFNKKVAEFEAQVSVYQVAKIETDTQIAARKDELRTMYEAIRPQKDALDTREAVLVSREKALARAEADIQTKKQKIDSILGA